MKVCFGCEGIELKIPLTKLQTCWCTPTFAPIELFFIHNAFEKIITKELRYNCFQSFSAPLFSGCSPLLLNILRLKSFWVSSFLWKGIGVLYQYFQQLGIPWLVVSCWGYQKHFFCLIWGNFVKYLTYQEKRGKGIQNSLGPVPLHSIWFLTVRLWSSWSVPWNLMRHAWCKEV